MGSSRIINISVWFLLHMVGSIAFADFIFENSVIGLHHGIWIQLSSVWKNKRRVKEQKLCPNSTASPHFGMYKKRELFQDLAPLLWNSFRTSAALLQKEKTGHSPSRIELFDITHVQANGQAVNEPTQDALVFAPERHGRVCGYAAGVTPPKLWGPSSSRMYDLEK